MCIAIYSPKGTMVPSKAYLMNSWDSNPDGAGFAYNTNDGRVRILKGFMTWESFWDTFSKFSEKEDFQNKGVLMHFRITTHGGTNPECTHPFPLCADIGIMQKTDIITDFAVEHNGIISLTSGDATSAAKAGIKASDTMKFIELYMSKIATNKDWFHNANNWDLIYDLVASKIACLAGNGEIMSTNGFTKGDDGNFYSNTSYQDSYYSSYYSYGTSKTYPSHYDYGDYDDDPIAMDMFGPNGYYGGDGDYEYFRYGFLHKKKLIYESYHDEFSTKKEAKAAKEEKDKVINKYIPKLQKEKSKKKITFCRPYSYDDYYEDDVDEEGAIPFDEEFETPDQGEWGIIPELEEIYPGYEPVMLLGPGYFCSSKTTEIEDYLWDEMFPMLVDDKGHLYFIDRLVLEDNRLENMALYVDDVTVHKLSDIDNPPSMRTKFEFTPNVQILTTNLCMN